ncbi:hypothetical protein QYF36_000152 [Acer negundo]|nr:hypothetical protein QYF36_000152 [Acer negundo]
MSCRILRNSLKELLHLPGKGSCRQKDKLLKLFKAYEVLVQLLETATFLDHHFVHAEGPSVGSSMTKPMAGHEINFIQGWGVL